VKELDREEEEEEPYLLKISASIQTGTQRGTALLDGSLPHQRS
jgi:hypothetical protein